MSDRRILPMVAGLCLLLLAPSTLHAQTAVQITGADAWYGNHVPQGYVITPFNYPTDICVVVQSDSLSPVYARSFNLLLGLNDTGFFLEEVRAGGQLSHEWEYFTYRIGAPSGLCSSCPPTFLRLRGIADLDDGVSPSPAAYQLSGCIAEIRVRSSFSAYQVNQCFHLDFCSLDCEDNTIISVGGDTVFAASSGVTLGDTFDPVACPSEGPVRDATLEFSSGALCIQDFGECCDPNLDGISSAIGDAVWFMRYFMYGDAALESDPNLRAIQEFYSDFNNDGQLLGIADYLTLLNILTYGSGPLGGGAPLRSSEPPDPATATITTAQDDGSNFVLGVKTTQILGGAHFVFDLNGATAGVPELLQDVPGITIQSHQASEQLRVVISPPPNGIPTPMDAGSYELMRIPTSNPAALKLVHADLSDIAGHRIEAKLETGAVPVSFVLGQNIPNPFNAGTVIPFTLEHSDHVRIDVFNVLGRRVATIADDDFPAGSHEVTWQASDESGAPLATGIYFYRLSISSQNEVRKMVVLK